MRATRGDLGDVAPRRARLAVRKQAWCAWWVTLVAGGVAVVACSLNPQPLPPGDSSEAGSAVPGASSGSGGSSGSGSSSGSSGSGSSGGSSGSGSSGGALLGSAGDGSASDGGLSNEPPATDASFGEASDAEDASDVTTSESSLDGRVDGSEEGEALAPDD